MDIAQRAVADHQQGEEGDPVDEGW